MLFPLSPYTERSCIFTALNSELLHFLRSSIEAQYFDRSLFSQTVGNACWSNSKTKEKFQELWTGLQALTAPQRRSLYEDINSKQQVNIYFDDRESQFPVFYIEAIAESLGKLTKHLYNSTKNLVPIQTACGETWGAHFTAYCRLNDRLCQVCGTELLAQPRVGVLHSKQWLSAYDHLLSKDKHPAYGIHPDNLFPLCFTCNSKAKGTKELLIKKVGDQLVRRLSFYPSEQSCINFVTAELIDQDTSLSLSINWDAQDADTLEKIEAWDEVYQVKSRVEGIDADIILKINDDYDQPLDLDDFKNQLVRKARRPSNRALRSEPMKFWRYKLYDWLSNESNDLIEAIWEMIEQRRDDDNYRDEYGI